MHSLFKINSDSPLTTIPIALLDIASKIGEPEFPEKRSFLRKGLNYIQNNPYLYH